VYTSLPFRTLWPNWLKFFWSLKKNLFYDRKNKPSCRDSPHPSKGFFQGSFLPSMLWLFFWGVFLLQSCAVCLWTLPPLVTLLKWPKIFSISLRVNWNIFGAQTIFKQLSNYSQAHLTRKNSFRIGTGTGLFVLSRFGHGTFRFRDVSVHKQLITFVYLNDYRQAKCHSSLAGVIPTHFEES